MLEKVACAAPPSHDPFLDLVPPQGVKLTPRHYAYLKISEGCNNRCSFCIIPKLRGDLVSRPLADVMREAEKLVNAGVKELLVITRRIRAPMASTSSTRRAAGATGTGGRASTTCRRRSANSASGADALCLPPIRMSTSHAADGGGQDPSLPRHPVPARRLRKRPEGDATPASQDKVLRASANGARPARISRSARPSSSASPARRRRISRSCSPSSTRPGSSGRAASSTSP